MPPPLPPEGEDNTCPISSPVPASEGVSLRVIQVTRIREASGFPSKMVLGSQDSWVAAICLVSELTRGVGVRVNCRHSSGMPNALKQLR